jgi:E3 ubiquitin-protein ligase SHPRH
MLCLMQGLEWMLRRERKNDALGRGLLSLHPLWLQLITRSGEALYVQRCEPHYLTTSFIPAPISSTCGGFLCDEVGGCHADACSGT